MTVNNSEVTTRSDSVCFKNGHAFFAFKKQTQTQKGEDDLDKNKLENKRFKNTHRDVSNITQVWRRLCKECQSFRDYFCSQLKFCHDLLHDINHYNLFSLLLNMWRLWLIVWYLIRKDAKDKNDEFRVRFLAKWYYLLVQNIDWTEDGARRLSWQHLDFGTTETEEV